MLPGMSFSSAYNRIALFYGSNEKFLNDAAKRIASGIKLRNPSDGVGDYFHAQSLNREDSVSQMIQRDIVGAQSLLDVAGKAGTFVIDDLTKMQEFITTYQDPSSNADDKMGAKAEFDAYAAKINDFIGAAMYNGRRIVADTGATPLASVMLDPNDTTYRMNISFTSGDVADTTGLDIADPNVQTAFDAVYSKATSYMAKVSAYQIGLRAQANMVNTRIINSSMIADKLSKIDDGAEMSVYTDRMVKQQMSISMMGQAVSDQNSVINLLR